MKVSVLVPSEIKQMNPAWLRWRITGPAKYINNLTNHRVVIIDETEDIKDTDILVLPRICDIKLDWLSQVRAAGIKIIYDVDDDMWSDSFIDQQVRMYSKPDYPEDILDKIANVFVETSEKSKAVLQMCDAVTAASTNLLQYIETFYTGPVLLVPNALDVDEFTSAIFEEKKTAEIIIGWAGGSRPYADLRDMHMAWRRLVQNTGYYIKFRTAGWRCSEIVDDPYLRHFITHVDWKEDYEYAQSMQVDIGCCSVENTKFNKRKTTIKVWEYAMAGATVVGSSTLYHDEPILVAEGADGWFYALEYFIVNKQARITMGDMMRDRVTLSHDLKSEYYRWIQAYERILGWHGNLEKD